MERLTSCRDKGDDPAQRGHGDPQGNKQFEQLAFAAENAGRGGAEQHVAGADHVADGPAAGLRAQDDSRALVQKIGHGLLEGREQDV